MPGNRFDALIVGFYDVAELKFVARVRNGFVAGFGERFTSN